MTVSSRDPGPRGGGRNRRVPHGELPTKLSAGDDAALTDLRKALGEDHVEAGTICELAALWAGLSADTPVAVADYVGVGSELDDGRTATAVDGHGNPDMQDSAKATTWILRAADGAEARPTTPVVLLPAL